MSVAAPENLDRRAVPWLFATALATTLPHVEYQPASFSAVAALMLAWGAWLWWRGLRLPGNWILAVMVAIGCALVLLEYRTLLGRNAGVAMLFLFMAMKLLELRSRRDAYVVVNLGYFLLLTHYFNSQSIATGVWLLAAMTLVTATLIRLHGGQASAPWPTLRQAGTMILQALPFLLVLYLLFPRVSGPLWGLPQDAATARTGLSDQMSPGSISNLALSPEIAFRARFDGPLPNRESLYWRGPVMEEYDGATWSRGSLFGQRPAVEALSSPLDYEVTLEPNEQRWLLVLDAPLTLPPESVLTSGLSVVSRSPLNQRRRYLASSAASYRFNLQESAATLGRNTRLPAGRHPKARALAEGWVREGSTPEQLVRKALNLFNQQEFAYTLQPPILGPDPVDEFLFQTRRGFCEHYASAFAVLMRAASVPARVVGGYLGGEVNPVDGYLVVRQSDAHAWAEVWLAGRGWVRVDPTAAVSPARVESGLMASIPATDAFPALVRLDNRWLRGLRHRWEAVNNSWNQWVLGYNPETQRRFLTSLGFPDPDWRTLVPILLAACGAILLAITAWILYRRPRLDPAQRLWQQALKRLRRRKVACAAWETPLAFAERLRIERPELAEAVEALAAAYCRARYGAGTADLHELRAAVARLP